MMVGMVKKVNYNEDNSVCSIEVLQCPQRGATKDNLYVDISADSVSILIIASESLTFLNSKCGLRTTLTLVVSAIKEKLESMAILLIWLLKPA